VLMLLSSACRVNDGAGSTPPVNAVETARSPLGDAAPSVVGSSPLALVRAPSLVNGSSGSEGEGRSLVPFAGGTTDVDYNDGTLSVEAGEPGSVTLVDAPGTAPIGRPVRCTWHKIIAVGTELGWELDPTVPVADGGYVLRCVHPDDGSAVSGYPLIVVYDPVEPIPGGAVGVTEVAKFAVDSISFELPTPVLSPPGEQVVGVETWLGVSSRLTYPSVSAQAGNTWATVRPVLREAVWTLGDGATVNCATDIATTWDSAAPASQSTTCSHAFESVSGPSPFPGRVDVSWTIYQRTDRHPNTWTVWGVVTRSAPVSFTVGELQSVIR